VRETPKLWQSGTRPPCGLYVALDGRCLKDELRTKSAFYVLPVNAGNGLADLYYASVWRSLRENDVLWGPLPEPPEETPGEA
jgi:hypothetical protein